MSNRPLAYLTDKFSSALSTFDQAQASYEVDMNALFEAWQAVRFSSASVESAGGAKDRYAKVTWSEIVDATIEVRIRNSFAEIRDVIDRPK